MKTIKLSCKEARDISIVEMLAVLGHFPKRQSEREAWYLSPFRSETEASFKVSLSLNRWYDHGEGIGGNCIDLVCKIKECSVGTALYFLKHLDFQTTAPILKLSSTLSRKLKITEVKEIENSNLITYLSERKIPINIAKRYCREVHYVWSGRSYYSIGLKNRSEGWELRNAYCKNGSSPKDITLILKKGSKNLAVVEGMFDLLSLVKEELNYLKEASILVLNSISFLEKAFPIIREFENVALYLDRDEAGRKATSKLLNRHTNTIDRSDLYTDYHDLNDWIVNRVK
ncbi:Toprim domain-containing protein [Dokdonia sp. Hel_I_63]|jgi:hypothetical protein|uniref:toprim domain-containing protein n=1 Tax=unclassified Dokdonia TaxID=2615033 RepID=UPI00020A6F4C|nr:MULTISPECIES: toprim domain-containing protein [unclassified Dokdonia]AEE19101.1 DNA primase [Dokdonia sp. 4H-3-7-5]AWH73795.1 DNA primase [Dokdonia sp. Dokd-P16]TVZ21667.1 Toprim domain-containing protein [Dokdonia sp. Hel_I_63]